MGYTQRRINLSQHSSPIVFDFDSTETKVEGDKLYLKVKECKMPLSKGSKVIFTKTLTYGTDGKTRTTQAEFIVLSNKNNVIEVMNLPPSSLFCSNVLTYDKFDADMDDGGIKSFNYLSKEFDPKIRYCVLTFNNSHNISENAKSFRLKISTLSKWQRTLYFKDYEDLLGYGNGKSEQFYSIRYAHKIKGGQVQVKNSIVKGPWTMEEYEMQNKSTWAAEAIIKEDGMEVKKPIFVTIKETYNDEPIIIWHQWINGELKDINQPLNIMKYWKVDKENPNGGFFVPKTPEYSLTDSFIQEKRNDIDYGKIETHFYKHFEKTIDGNKLQIIMNDELFAEWAPYAKTHKYSIVYDINGETYDDRVFFKQCGKKVILSEGVTAKTISEFLNFNLQINENFATNLHQQESLTEKYVDNVINSSVPEVIDYEKSIVKPYIQKDGKRNIFTQANRIIFNLHFRDRMVSESELSETWSTEDTKMWNNFYEPNFSIDKSDLLWQLGFDADDIFFQKMKLQKSFLRLSFYDSNDTRKQNLLFYSTVFIDAGELYGKYNTLKTKATNNEIDGYDKDSDVIYIDDDNLPRLSSQFVITNKFNSNKSSEGFYLYLFNKTLPKKLPKTIYMKVEFNHAKYGKTVPFLYFTSEDNAPIQNRNSIRLNYITQDSFGENTVDMDGYFKDTFIKMEVRYDEDSKSYMYYLPYDNPNNEQDIIFNLFEPRING